MNRFVRLTLALDDASDPAEKMAALMDYFREAPAADAAWGLYFLLGRRLGRALPGPELRELAIEASGYPAWLVDESIAVAGDLAEAAALLVECGTWNAECGIKIKEPRGLGEVIETWVKPLRDAPESERRRLIPHAWAELGAPARILFNRLIGGEPRPAAPRAMVIRALAEAAGLDAAEIAQRLETPFEPTAAAFAWLVAREGAPRGPGPPYPFQLAAVLEGPPEALGPREEWQAEWHYEGVRAQVLARRGGLMVWSRAGELLTAQCPELGDPRRALPDGTALDGVLAGWGGDGPLPPERLRRRLARKTLDKKTLAEAPLVFVVFDLLELAGRDLRAEPLRERRRMLEDFFKELEAGDRRPEDGAAGPFRLAPVHTGRGWKDLDILRGRARAAGARGLILKRREAPYTEGRTGGDWLKWPAAPHLIDAVLLYAERGGAGLHTRLTLGVWAEELAAVAQAEAGLAEEWDEIESFIRENTIEKHGPVRRVRPELVFELAFEGVERAPRRKAGLILRGAQVRAWRRGAAARRAGTLAMLRDLLDPHTGGNEGVEF